MVIKLSLSKVFVLGVHIISLSSQQPLFKVVTVGGQSGAISPVGALSPGGEDVASGVGVSQEASISNFKECSISNCIQGQFQSRVKLLKSIQDFSCIRGSYSRRYLSSNMYISLENMVILFKNYNWM